MTQVPNVAEKTARIALLMEERLGVRGAGLEAKLRKCRRIMPTWVRRAADQLVEAERLSGHPKLMMRTDPAEVKQAFGQCERWLLSVDPSERRKDAFLRFLARNAFNLLVVAALFVLTLRLTGQI